MGDVIPDGDGRLDFRRARASARPSRSNSPASDSQATSKSFDLTPAELQALRTPFADALSKLFAGSPETLFSVPTSGIDPKAAPITDTESQMLAALRTEGDPRRAMIDKTMAGDFVGSNRHLGGGYRGGPATHASRARRDPFADPSGPLHTGGPVHETRAGLRLSTGRLR